MMHRDHLIEACILLAFKINSGLWEDSSVKACGYSKANILSRVFLFLFRCRTTFGSSFSFSFFSRFWVFRGRRPVHPRLCTYFKHRVFEPFSNLGPIQSPILNAKCGVGQPCKPAEVLCSVSRESHRVLQSLVSKTNNPTFWQVHILQQVIKHRVQRCAFLIRSCALALNDVL